MKKILITLIIVGVIISIIGIIASEEILTILTTNTLDKDNILTYTTTNRIEIVNDLTKDKIANVELKNDLDNNYIEVGKDRVVFQLDVENYKDYSNAIKQTKIINMKNNQEVSKEFKWVYAVYDDVVVNDYTEVCSKGELNKTTGLAIEICTQEISGNHTEKIIKEWVDLGTDLPKGNITIGFMTDVNEGDYYDGIPTLFGKEVTEWVTWEAEVVDAHGIAFNSPTGDNGKFGVIINTTCSIGFKINKIALATGVTADRAWIFNTSNEVTLDAGNCVAEVCTFAGNSLGLGNKSVVVGLTASNATTWNQAQTSATTLPIVDTNVNWIAGVVYHHPEYAEYSNILFEVVNISSQCISNVPLQNITGRVVNASDDKAIAGATIVILNSTGGFVYNTTSNESGYWYYSYENGTLINYTIVGYNTNNITQGGKAYPFVSQIFG